MAAELCPEAAASKTLGKPLGNSLFTSHSVPRNTVFSTTLYKQNLPLPPPRLEPKWLRTLSVAPVQALTVQARQVTGRSQQRWSICFSSARSPPPAACAAAPAPQARPARRPHARCQRGSIASRVSLPPPPSASLLDGPPAPPLTAVGGLPPASSSSSVRTFSSRTFSACFCRPPFDAW